MIIRIIDNALITHKFTKEYEIEHTKFYKRESGSAIRFAILHKLDELPNPAELNTLINKSVPGSFASNPTFKKNCDLICVYHLNRLAEFKNNEEKIFALEEDPHFFKKYILYYSDDEVSAIQDYSYADLKKTISDKNLFNSYKDDPLAATEYSVAAKIFIKLPFLELPYTQEALLPLRQQAEKAVTEEDLGEIYTIIQKFTENNADELIKELIESELENITN
ncbi:ABC-three component system middle component 1 [Gilliamella apis]|uniref:ABC-three component system middle component 1 n=1 Tax=Gilliamella apis TaxID=1970738 RepID=UPI00080E504C|nr:ABC-three component system middle component 1 [Gilliamella apis]OCG02755.1 hypothetical protein A9G19_07555 [Gilliamella apis]